MQTASEREALITTLTQQVEAERARADTAEAAYAHLDAKFRAQRKRLADLWGYVLTDLIDSTFDDGTSVLTYIFQTEPELAERFRAIFAPPVTPRVRVGDRVQGAKRETFGGSGT